MKDVSLDRLTGIIAFARAASLGSYTAASKVLSLSPSAVSKSIQRLEVRLGVKLFNRTTRSLTLTTEGYDLYQRALRLLHEAEEIEQAAVSARSEPSGLIKITAPYAIGNTLIASHLPKFRERYANLKIELCLNDNYTDLVEEGIDVAIRIGPLGDSRLIARKLVPNTVCLYSSPAYLKKNTPPQSVEELSHHSLVSVRMPNSGQLLRWPMQVSDKIIEFIPDAHILVNSTDAALTVIREGGGIGMLPTYLAYDYHMRGELIPVMIGFHSVRMDIIAFWPESRRGNPNVKVFLDFLSEVFPEKAPWNSFQNTLPP
ncbi:LysR family transcriptional regulator [Pectobacterium carotovorum]|uniref:LysR family transcriptional regulator n=1 Tax=Pectobacterium carotovorum TaxID=554 RepID=UPI00208D93AC|nr:LysR family transcriptional regulator [Pectobacterium carotovorum]GKV92308.1 LysR family transcriptional regulator [Pectobacterium carotovorum subsp. carotovorum]